MDIYIEIIDIYSIFYIIKEYISFGRILDDIWPGKKNFLDATTTNKYWQCINRAKLYEINMCYQLFSMLKKKCDMRTDVCVCGDF